MSVESRFWVQYFARDDAEEELAALMLRVAADSRTVSGCLEYSLHRNSVDPRLVVVLERFSDQGAVRRHRLLLFERYGPPGHNQLPRDLAELTEHWEFWPVEPIIPG